MRSSPNEPFAGVTAPRFKPYPAYKDSGIEWLGQIPAHWDVRRLKTMASVQLSNVDKKSVEGEVAVKLCNYVDVYYNEHITAELEFMPATATPDQVRRFSLRRGDVLITKDSESWTDIAVPAVVASDLPDILCGYHLALLRPEADQHGPFLARAFSAIGPRDQFQVAANGITRFGLGGDAIRTSVFAVPPKNEEREIARFLDRETARIDALVAENKRLMGLLNEQRASLIAQTVTRGLDPNVPFKQSGVQWLDQIPGHWEVRRLKWIAGSLGVGVVVNPSQYVTNEGVPFLYGSDVGEGVIHADDARRMSAEDSRKLWKSRLHAGDLVMVRVGAPGVTAVVPPELDGANCASILVVRGHARFDSPWLCYTLNSRFVRSQVRAVQYGAAQEQFNVSHAVDFLVPFPDRDEQRRISAFLDAETSRIDALVRKIREAMESLKDYRTALISAAVTGKIDVREEVA